MEPLKFNIKAVSASKKVDSCRYAVESAIYRERQSTNLTVDKAETQTNLIRSESSVTDKRLSER